MSRSRTTTDTAYQAMLASYAPDELIVRLPTHRRPSHPGEVLCEDYLPDYGWTPEELAARLHVAPDVVEDVLAERAPVTPELALRLGRLFGQSPAFWIKLQLSYDLYDALHSVQHDLDRIEPVALESAPVRKAG